MPETFQLKDFEYVHDLFLQIMEELVGGEIPLPAAMEAIRQGTPPSDAAQAAVRWLWVLEDGIVPQLFRRSIERLAPQEKEILVLVRYFAGKSPMQQEDIERLEWLVTYVFRSRSVADYHSSTAEILAEIQGWLEGAQQLSPAAQALLMELWEVREEVFACRAFQELTQSGLIARGRSIKQKLTPEFSQPEVLAGVVNYNLISGQKFDQLLSEAQAAGGLPDDVKTKDYRSAAEDFKQWIGKAAAAGAAPDKKPKASVPQPASATPARAGTAEKQASGTSDLKVDPKEGALVSMVSKLTQYARDNREASSIPLPNSTLKLSPAETQFLVVEYPATEKSFRVDLARVMRRALGLLGAIQEEIELFRVRRSGDYLWRQHATSLSYLLNLGADNLSELENLRQEAGLRGLYKKADQLGETGGRLRQRLQEATEVCKQLMQQAAGA